MLLLLYACDENAHPVAKLFEDLDTWYINNILIPGVLKTCSTDKILNVKLGNMNYTSFMKEKKKLNSVSSQCAHG